MSIQTEISRLNSAKSAISSAITEKGVTVPSGTKLDGMAELIKGISGGGGDDGWISDGNTHIWIHLEEGRTSPMLGCCPNGTVTVDWGDGAAKDTLTGTSTRIVKWTPKHNYAKPGDYVITLIVNGTVGFGGDTNTNAFILRYSSSDDTRNSTYQNAVRKVELGNGTSFNSNAFQYCQSLVNIAIPETVTSIATNAFQQCVSLSSIIIPAGVTFIGYGAFNQCHSLSSIIVPAGVTSINTFAFGDCSGVRYYDFTAHTSVPILASSQYGFTNIAADCEIRVPATLYDEWKAAKNWADYADYIVAV